MSLDTNNLARRKNWIMNTRHAANTQHLIDAVLTSPGETAPTLLRAVEDHAAELSGRSTRKTSQVPAELVNYVNKVTLHAYKTTDEDIEALRTAGYSEDAFLEITLCAALGAGIARLERGLVALKGDQQCD